MAKFLIKEASYINGAIAQPGEIVDYDLPEGTTTSPNLEPVTEDTDEKQKRKSAKGEPA